ncbi:hypothetical protein RchiOBHm_Chr2g0108491 [Rosa chinensis]|uniref:Uncharacterized protein n=1 Tax=Rosa chinensis TaxID=74649 RepID=A0A2P6RP75_ROSCH|nr:hypothetical protein RchiOBHm_Chr2g0108491 [Rosa chinensis]
MWHSLCGEMFIVQSLFLINFFIIFFWKRIFFLLSFFLFVSSSIRFLKREKQLLSPSSNPTQLRNLNLQSSNFSQN